jgi:aryl-alcohol dehydrogenase-like predicted oxidoreductase
MSPNTIPGTSLPVSDLVFGTNVFGWSIHDQSEANLLLDAVVDSGITFLDSADMYVQWWADGVGGESEKMIGQWLARSGRRDDVIIATKVGKMTRRPGLTRKNILAACDDSLSRLGIDHIDLYYAHLDDRETPLEESLGAFQELIGAGKVLALGASNFESHRLHEAHRVATANGLTPFSALQNEYNLITRSEYEKDSVPAIKELGLLGFPYFGLASGFLTGKYRAGSTTDSVRQERVARDYLTPGNLAIVERVTTVAKRHGVAPASVAIEWLRRQPGVSAPIVSARTPNQLSALMERVELSPEEMTILSSQPIRS